MKAIVFAAGIGTRLRPFTQHHPKALAPIGATTALGLVVEKLIKAGADGIVINVHHFAEQVREWLSSRNYDVDIEISDESDLLLDTGGGLAKIYRQSSIIAAMPDSEAILIHNADIITDFPILEMVTACNDVDGVILADPKRNTARKFLFDHNNWLRGWCNNTSGQTKPENLDTANLHQAAFDGVHCMKKSLLAKISAYCGELHPFSITDYYINECTAGNIIKRFTPADDFKWYDIGTPERLETAQQAYNQGLLKL